MSDSRSTISYYSLAWAVGMLLGAFICGACAMIGTGTEPGDVITAGIGAMALGMGVMFMGIALNTDRTPVLTTWGGALILLVGASIIAYITGTVPFSH